MYSNGSFQFDDLENLGYRCLALFFLFFFEEDVQSAYTTDCECIVTPSVLPYTGIDHCRLAKSVRF